MPRKIEPFRIVLDAHTALNWLQKLPQVKRIPGALQFLSLLSMLTNKRVELVLRVVDRDGSR